MIFSSLNYLSSSPSYITRLYLDRQTLPPRASRSTDEFRKTSRYCCSQPSSIFQHPQAAPKDCFFTEFQLDISNPYLLLTMDTSRLLGKEWSESDAESESPTPDRVENHHCQTQCNSGHLCQQRNTQFIYVVFFLFAYFIASVPFLMLTWYRGAASSGYRIPAIPYCKFPGRRWRGIL